MNARNVFNTLVATVSCGHLSNVLLTVVKLSELSILVYSDSKETSMAFLSINRPCFF